MYLFDGKICISSDGLHNLTSDVGIMCHLIMRNNELEGREFHSDDWTCRQQTQTRKTPRLRTTVALSSADNRAEGVRD